MMDRVRAIWILLVALVLALIALLWLAAAPADARPRAFSAYDGDYANLFGAGGYDSEKFYYCGWGRSNINNTGLVWTFLYCSPLTIDPFTRDSQHLSVGASAQWDEGTGVNQSEIRLAFYPPPAVGDVTSFSMRCDSSGSKVGSGSGNAFTFENATNVSKTGGAACYDANSCSTTATFTRNSGTWDEYLPSFGVWDLTGAWPASLVHVKPYAAVPTSNDRSAARTAECWLTDFSGEWVPPAIPTATPEPTPTGDWAVLPIPIGTVPVGRPPTTIEFGITDPISETCYTLVPSTEQEVAWWGGVYTVGFAAVEVCNSERTIGLVVDEWDFGATIAGLVSLMGVGGLWLLLRRS